MSKKRGHIISMVMPGSIAEELELKPKDRVVSINGHEIEDIFDYRFFCEDEEIVLGIISSETGEFWEFEIEKDSDEDLGIEFENGLMDDYKSCRNNCVFCFIDQLPKGMRDTLYFKDDDARLSFLQGNYVTLTNMSEHDVERICYYRLSPINISIHTTNPELRCRMLNNRFAGEALEKIKIFCDAGIEINGQVVLCKGINDGAELDRTLTDIERYLPNLRSVSIVPVGLTKYREGLCPLEPFSREDAVRVLEQIKNRQEYYLKKYGTRVVYAGDEWYLKAGIELPQDNEYEDFPQLENGVGMLRSLISEVDRELDVINDEDPEWLEKAYVITGEAAYPVICGLCDKVKKAAGGSLQIEVCKIYNDFFGQEITVSGLITGIDILNQLDYLKNSEDEGILLVPCNMLKADENVFLDDISLEEIENTLQKKSRIVKSSGASFVASFLKEYNMDDYTNELNKYETGM